MVIVRISGGLGNQFYIYAIGRYLAYKLDTELKLDISAYGGKTRLNSRHSHNFYELCDFNIQENFATAQEIRRVKENGLRIPSQASLSNLENFQGDIFIEGFVGGEGYFINIIDILRKEFTLKKPLSSVAETWRQKIMNTKCSVSMHFRYGDYAYLPGLDKNGAKPWFNVTPLSYCYTSVEVLKQRYSTPPPTVFVFSDNLFWIKESLHLDVPTEFVEGCKSAPEELTLMGLCENNITPGSSFSKTALMLNPNPNKIVIQPKYVTAQEEQQYIHQLKENHLIITNNHSPVIDSGERIIIPCNFYEQSEFKIPPIFSLLLLVNDDAKNLPATLENLLGQDYKYYEIIIIDNASTDGSDKICQDAIKGRENVTYKRLSEKVNDATAWNKAFKAAQGKYVSFLKAGDRFLGSSLTSLYLTNSSHQVDIIHMFSWLKKDAGGNVTFANEKFSAQRDAKFKEEKRGVIMSEDGREAARLLLNQQMNPFLGTKLYNVEFLKEYKIKFEEQLDDKTAELVFQTETFLKSKDLMFISSTFYVASLQNVMEFERCFTARIDILLIPKTQGDFQMLSVSDKKATVWKPVWLNKNGIGYQIQSLAGEMELVAKATADGQIRLYLRGLDVRTPEDHSKSIPCWIDYTKLVVNGKIISDKITPTWHDKPFNYNLDVKDGEEIKIQVEWLPHKSDI